MGTLMSRATSCFVTALALTGILVGLSVSARQPEKPNDPLYVELSIDQLTCDQPTDGDEAQDEVYMVLAGSTSKNGHFADRLPRHKKNDDYYRFRRFDSRRSEKMSDWVNKDGIAVGHPVIWHGPLADGESAQFLVALREQDNRDIGPLRDLLTPGLNNAANIAKGGPPPANRTEEQIATDAANAWLIDSFLKVATDLAKVLPDTRNHDLIGVVVVHVKNSQGKVEVQWATPQELTFKGVNRTVAASLNTADPYAAALVMQNKAVAAASVQFTASSEGAYRAIFRTRVTKGPAPKALRLSKSWNNEVCDPQPLRLTNCGCTDVIRVGDVVTVRPAGQKLNWMSVEPKKLRPVFGKANWPQGIVINYPTGGPVGDMGEATVCTFYRPSATIASENNEKGDRFRVGAFTEEEFGRPPMERP